jgi:penicillin-binding protein 1B
VSSTPNGNRRTQQRFLSLPAAGKTGTSRDGWFAGYTKDFLVIAWVGYDDNRDLNLEGAHSALPIWTEFMSKATRLYPPRDPEQVNFEAPEEFSFVKIDADTLQRANDSCPNTFEEAFISGTEPAASCTAHVQEFSNAIEQTITDPRKKSVKASARFFKH